MQLNFIVFFTSFQKCPFYIQFTILLWLPSTQLLCQSHVSTTQSSYAVKVEVKSPPRGVYHFTILLTTPPHPSPSPRADLLFTTSFVFSIVSSSQTLRKRYILSLFCLLYQSSLLLPIQLPSQTPFPVTCWRNTIRNSFTSTKKSFFAVEFSIFS